MVEALPSVILLSGGLDSAANLALGKNHILLALTVNYGQRAAVREIEAARQLCLYYQIRHEVVACPWLGKLGGNALTDPRLDLPSVHPAELDRSEVTTQTAARVWVPNRNGVFIQIAAAYAERLKIGQVLVGFNREEAATFPDNTQEFLDTSTQALRYSTQNAVRVTSYSTEMNKLEITQTLSRLDPTFPFHFLWSCYEGDSKPCGLCESCQRFMRSRAPVEAMIK